MRTNPKNIYKNRRKTRKIFGISFLTVKPLEILVFSRGLCFLNSTDSTNRRRKTICGGGVL